MHHAQRDSTQRAPPSHDSNLLAPGDWMLILTARFVRMIGAALLILAGSYVIFFAHIFYLRATLAGDDFEVWRRARSRWIPYLWGGGWRAQQAVVLGGSGARDPQVVVGSLHALHGSSSAAAAATSVTVTFTSAHAQQPPLLIHLPAIQRCARLNANSTQLVGRAPVVARFDRCDHALGFLRTLAPDVRIQLVSSSVSSANAALARPLAYDAHAHAAVAQSVRGVDAAAPVELRMWILPTGAPLIATHLSWSLLDVLRILVRNRRLPLQNTDVDVMLPALELPQQQQHPTTTTALQLANARNSRRTVFVALPSPAQRRALIDCVAPRDAMMTAAFAVASALFALFLSHETARALERLVRVSA